MKSLKLKKKDLPHIIDLYKFYVRSAESVTQRRQTANSFFLTLNASLLGLNGYLTIGKDVSLGVSFMVIVLTGIIASYSWYRLIRSYQQLNTAKFHLIHQIENHVPFQLFHEEWQGLAHGRDKRIYHQSTSIEMQVPIIFIGLHVSVLLTQMPWGKLWDYWQQVRHCA